MTEPATHIVALYGQRTRDAIDDFLEHAAMGERLLSRGRQALDTDETLQLALEAIVFRLGESVARMDQQFIDDHPDLALRDIKGARNIVAHQYHIIDHAILWVGLERDLPPVVNGLRNLIDDVT